MWQRFRCAASVRFVGNLFDSIQGVCDWQGRPIYVSGPHIGVRSDIRLWREEGPNVSPGECVLGDKAYVSDDVVDVLAPYKRPKGGRLTRAQKDFNRIHR